MNRLDEKAYMTVGEHRTYRTRVRPGDRFRVELPYSEVCCHMRVAGKVYEVELLDRPYPMVQIYRPDGSPLSGAIGTGEAGVYADQLGYYAYVAEEES